jgi:hypothetical protein
MHHLVFRFFLLPLVEIYKIKCLRDRICPNWKNLPLMQKWMDGPHGEIKSLQNVLFITFTFQYGETNMMHFLSTLLIIKGLCTFQTLLTLILVQPTDITRMQYTKCCLFSASWGWASNAWNMYRPLILNILNKKFITLDYYTEIQINPI